MHERTDLILNRRNGDLWIHHNSSTIEVMYNVTGVKRMKEDSETVKILRNGELVGLIWYVEGIGEQW